MQRGTFIFACDINSEPIMSFHPNHRLIVSYNAESGSVVVTTAFDYLCDIATPESLWQLLRDYAADPRAVLQQYIPAQATFYDRVEELGMIDVAVAKQRAANAAINLEDLDL